MIAPTPPHDPLTVEDETPFLDRPAALARRHARLIAFVMWAGMAWLAYLSSWFVPFIGGSLATFGLLLVWAESER